MKVLLALINRNLKVFLRNKSAVFFSFLAIIIIIALYALFLGDVQVQNIKSILNQSNITASDESIAWLVNSWIMAGLLSVNAVTITLGTYGTIVDDIEYKTSKDFISSPIKRTHVVLGYIISSWILTISLSIIGFVAIELYIVSQGGQLLNLTEMMQTLGIIVLSVISFSSVLFFIVSFIKSANVFGTVSSIIGTLIGFLAGIYIPIGILPNAVKVLVSLFPVSYSASMLRQIFMAKPSAQVFEGAPDFAVSDYNELFGVELYLNGYELSWFFMISSLILMSIIFYILGVLRVQRNKLL